MRKRAVVVLGLVSLLGVAAVFVAQLASNRAADRFEAFAIDDVMALSRGQEVQRELIDGEALVIKIGQERRLTVDLTEHRPGQVEVVAGWLPANEDAFQSIIINPTASNTVDLAAEPLRDEREAEKQPHGNQEAAPSLFEVFTVDDAMGYLQGEDVNQKPVDAEALVIQIDENRRLVIDLHERRPAQVTVWAGGLGMDDPPHQAIVIKPSAANVVYLSSDLLAAKEE